MRETKQKYKKTAVEFESYPVRTFRLSNETMDYLKKVRQDKDITWDELFKELAKK